MGPSRRDRTPEPQTSWPTEIATAVLTGVVTARWPSQRWSRGAQWALHGGMGALAAAGTGFAVSNPQRFFDEPSSGKLPTTPSPVLVVGAAAAVGLAAAGISRSGQAADAWVERSLAGRGVRRPRLWMGVAAAGLSLGMAALDRRRPAPDSTPAETVTQDSDGAPGSPVD